MSKVGLSNLNGLAFGKGPLTSSTSPLWSPYGPYSYGDAQMEADAAAAVSNGNGVAAVNGNGNGNGKSLMDKLFKGEVDIAGFAVPAAAISIAVGYYLFFSQNAPIPLRRNEWPGDSDGHSDVAFIRWLRGKPDAKSQRKLKSIKRKLSKRKYSRYDSKGNLTAKYKAQLAKRQSKKQSPSGGRRFSVDASGSKNVYMIDGQAVKITKQSKAVQAELRKLLKRAKDNKSGKSSSRAVVSNPRRRRNSRRSRR
jgi:hypothetical protein